MRQHALRYCDKLQAHSNMYSPLCFQIKREITNKLHLHRGLTAKQRSLDWAAKMLKHKWFLTLQSSKLLPGISTLLPLGNSQFLNGAQIKL